MDDMLTSSLFKKVSKLVQRLMCQLLLVSLRFIPQKAWYAAE